MHPLPTELMRFRSQHMNRIVVALPIRSDPRPDLVASIDKSGQWSARALMRPLRTATNRSTPTGCLTRSQGRPYVSRKALSAGMGAELLVLNRRHDCALKYIASPESEWGSWRSKMNGTSIDSPVAPTYAKSPRIVRARAHTWPRDHF